MSAGRRRWIVGLVVVAVVVVAIVVVRGRGGSQEKAAGAPEGRGAAGGDRPVPVLVGPAETRDVPIYRQELLPLKGTPPSVPETPVAPR